MNREPVQSSSLESIGYDPTTKTLEVQFRKGGIYQYLDVPAFIHRGLMLAASKGIFFNRNVEDRYPYREVENI